MSSSLCPMDCSLPSSSVHGISQARILEWVAFPSPGDKASPKRIHLTSCKMSVSHIFPTLNLSCFYSQWGEEKKKDLCRISKWGHFFGSEHITSCSHPLHPNLRNTQRVLAYRLGAKLLRWGSLLLCFLTLSRFFRQEYWSGLPFPSPKKAECWNTDAFKLWRWKRLLRVPWTARRSTQSILKEINSEYSLERLMLKLKFQYFGHLMQREKPIRKILLLSKIECRRRRERQRLR